MNDLFKWFYIFLGDWQFYAHVAQIVRSMPRGFLYFYIYIYYMCRSITRVVLFTIMSAGASARRRRSPGAKTKNMFQVFERRASRLSTSSAITSNMFFLFRGHGTCPSIWIIFLCSNARKIFEHLGCQYINKCINKYINIYYIYIYIYKWINISFLLYIYIYI